MATEKVIESVIDGFRDSLYRWGGEILPQVKSSAARRGVSVPHAMWGVLGYYRKYLTRSEKKTHSVVLAAGLGRRSFPRGLAKEPVTEAEMRGSLAVTKDILQWVDREEVVTLHSRYSKILAREAYDDPDRKGPLSDAVRDLDREVIAYLRKELWITNGVELYNLIGKAFKAL